MSETTDVLAAIDAAVEDHYDLGHVRDALDGAEWDDYVSASAMRWVPPQDRRERPAIRFGVDEQFSVRPCDGAACMVCNPAAASGPVYFAPHGTAAPGAGLRGIENAWSLLFERMADTSADTARFSVRLISDPEPDDEDVGWDDFGVYSTRTWPVALPRGEWVEVGFTTGGPSITFQPQGDWRQHPAALPPGPLLIGHAAPDTDLLDATAARLGAAWYRARLLANRGAAPPAALAPGPLGGRWLGRDAVRVDRPPVGDDRLAATLDGWRLPGSRDWTARGLDALLGAPAWPEHWDHVHDGRRPRRPVASITRLGRDEFNHEPPGP